MIVIVDLQGCLVSVQLRSKIMFSDDITIVYPMICRITSLAVPALHTSWWRKPARRALSARCAFGYGLLVPSHLYAAHRCGVPDPYAIVHFNIFISNMHNIIWHIESNLITPLLRVVGPSPNHCPFYVCLILPPPPHWKWTMASLSCGGLPPLFCPTCPPTCLRFWMNLACANRPSAWVGGKKPTIFSYLR